MKQILKNNKNNNNGKHKEHIHQSYQYISNKITRKKKVSIQLVYLEILLMLFGFYLKFVCIVEDFHPSLMSKNKMKFEIFSKKIFYLQILHNLEEKYLILV